MITLENKHIWWIVLGSILLGAFAFNFLMSWMFDFTIDYASEVAINRYALCLEAWVEEPLSNNRTLGEGNELCYFINDTIVCPQRISYAISELKSIN